MIHRTSKTSNLLFQHHYHPIFLTVLLFIQPRRPSSSRVHRHALKLESWFSVGYIPIPCILKFENRAIHTPGRHTCTSHKQLLALLPKVIAKYRRLALAVTINLDVLPEPKRGQGFEGE